MDARRNQVYNALFRSDGSGAPRRLTEDRAISLPDLAEEVAAMEGPRIVLGDGASLCLKALEEQEIPCRLAPPQLVMQNAVSVALCAGEAALRGGLIDPQALAPVYLRPPQALPLRDRQ